MPKTNAKGRNQWLQSAAAFIKNKNMDELDYHGKMLVNDAIADPKHIKSQYKKAERQFKKYESEFKEYGKTERHFNKLDKMSPMEKYQRLAGEAESRNVETRRDWTPEQRRATPPWESLDVPENELIYRK
jgi:tRNA G18 (ribose-2'-O)-methylase SpoU